MARTAAAALEPAISYSEIDLGGERLPAIAALSVMASSFVVGEDVERKPCAYVIINVTCRPQNSLQEQRRVCQRGLQVNQLDNDPGWLTDLQIAIDIDGPATTKYEIGTPQPQSLRVGDRWIVLIKIGLKENNLAARMSA